jgi:hypothetical protein
MFESFWVIPDIANIRTPLSILREQASDLTARTKGTLVGMVETKSITDDIEITLEISVPSLNDYRYRILTYRQPIELYPGIIFVSGPPRKVDDEAEFVEYVKMILSSDRIRNALASLLSQAVAA